LFAVQSRIPSVSGSDKPLFV